MKTVTLTKMLGAMGLALTLLSLPASARPTPESPAAATGAMVFGSVDLDKIIAGYGKKAAYDQQVQDLNTKLDAQFKQQVNYDMLTKSQQTQLTALLSKSGATSQDQASITALQAQSTKDAQELTTLQQKPSPTADDQTRLTALTQQHQAGQQALKDVADGYTAQVTARQQQLSTELSNTVREAITTIAKEKGLSMVFTSQVAIYSTNDITEDVLKRLNK